MRIGDEGEADVNRVPSQVHRVSTECVWPADDQPVRLRCVYFSNFLH